MPAMTVQLDKTKERRTNILSEVMLVLAIIAAPFLPSSNARGASPQAAPQVGEEYEIIKKYETSQLSSDGGSGSSRGRDTLLERVIGVRDGGLELEYDLPKDATAADRARSWQFPVRVFRPTNGSMRLLNRPELEARVEVWLKAAGWTRAACGRWIFTWNAFLIECDPQSVIKMVEAVDLRVADLRDGAPYQKPVTLDAALRERAKESISGTISVRHSRVTFASGLRSPALPLNGDVMTDSWRSLCQCC